MPANFVWCAVVWGLVAPDDVGAPRAEPPDRPSFVVRDGETTKPVANASVRVIGPFGDEDETFSDARGRAELACDFDLGETVNDGRRVAVSAPGYRIVTRPLFEYTGKWVDLNRPRVERPTVSLHRVDSKAPESETFTSSDFGRFYVVTLYDGDKFDALRSYPKQCSEHTPWYESKSGIVLRDDDALRFDVHWSERIRHGDGRPTDPWLVDDLIPVRWGGRRYLVEAGRRVEFCDAVNRGDEPRDDDRDDFLLGEGHERLAAEDLPEVPASWSQYLLKTPVQGKVTELLTIPRAGRPRPEIGASPRHDALPKTEFLFSELTVVTVGETERLIKMCKNVSTPRDPRVGDVVVTRDPSRTAPAAGSARAASAPVVRRP